MLTDNQEVKERKECEGICPSLELDEEVKEEANDDLAGKVVKGWFITWPRCGWPKEEVLDYLRSKFKTQGIKEYVICEEKHKNGEPHLHAFIKFRKYKKWTKDMFDLPPMACDVREKPYHGNVQTAKSPYDVCKYVEKGLNYIANFDIEHANANYSDLVCVNTSLILDPSNRQSRYFSTKGGSWDLKAAGDINTVGAGTMIVRAMNDGAYTTSPGWNVKVTLYVYWRYAKVL